MGTSHSKSHPQNDDQVKAVRRQIGKRSSINFLQRLESRPLPPRPVSFAAKTSNPEAELLFQAPLRPLTSHPMNFPMSFPALSPSSTATVVRADDYISHPPQDETKDDSEESEADIDMQKAMTSEANDVTLEMNTSQIRQSDDGSVLDGSEKSNSVPIETPQLSDGSTVDEPHEVQEPEHVHDDPFDDDDQGSEPGTPVARPRAPLTPVLRMPTPIGRDSPTTYGFDEAIETARFAISRDNYKKRATTGPELFRQALNLQISSGFTNVPPQIIPSKKPVEKQKTTEAATGRVYRPPRSRYPPSEIFRRAQLKYHPLPPPRAKELSPRTTRLLRRAWPENLLRDETTPAQNVRYALAMPLTHTQKSCHGRHGKWQESSNFLCPVECAICLCASDCSTDTAVSWMCEFCFLRICAECRAVLDSQGIEALMGRFADGSNTIEAKQARANRRSAA